MKNTNKTSGITLIALIITIIVMLILVTVTINLVFNGGLFNYAKKAAKETNNAIGDENRLLALLLGGKTVEEYVNGEGLANGELGLEYRLYKWEDEGEECAGVEITPKIGGIPTYEDYAKEILKGKTEAEVAQILVDGINYLNEINDWGRPTYENIDDLLEAFGLATIEELCAAEGYESLNELVIYEQCVEPWGFTDPYETYANSVLEGKTETEIAQIFVDGVNYWNEINENTTYNNINALLEDWGYNTIEELYTSRWI